MTKKNGYVLRVSRGFYDLCKNEHERTGDNYPTITRRIHRSLISSKKPKWKDNLEYFTRTG